MNNRRRIILPREAMQEQLIQQLTQQKPMVDMHGQPVPPNGTEIPFLQIPVIDNASYLLYAIGQYALDSEAFEQYPLIRDKIQEMHEGLLNLYKRFNVKETEYRQYCIAVPIEQTPTDAPEDLPADGAGEQGSNGAGGQKSTPAHLLTSSPAQDGLNEEGGEGNATN